jgi:hypothetical protein
MAKKLISSVNIIFNFSPFNTEEINYPINDKTMTKLFFQNFVISAREVLKNKNKMKGFILIIHGKRTSL